MIRQCSILENACKSLTESPVKALQGNQKLPTGYHIGVIAKNNYLAGINKLSAVAGDVGNEDPFPYIAEGQIVEVGYTNTNPSYPKSWTVDWNDTGSNSDSYINVNIVGLVYGFFSICRMFVYGPPNILYGTAAVHPCLNGAVNNFNVDWSTNLFGPATLATFVPGQGGSGYFEIDPPAGSVAVFWVGLRPADLPAHNFTMASRIIRQTPTKFHG